MMSSNVVSGYAAPPLPFRIGGTVTIDGVLITQATDTGLIIKVTKLNGTDYTPVAQDNDGLSAINWYIVDIPIFNAVDQPGGANTGETAVIHVYLNGKELSVTSPANAKLTVGATGANLQINLVSVTPSAPLAVSVPTVSEWGMIILALGFGFAGFFYMKKNSVT